MNGATSDQRLREIVDAASPATIDDVINIMQSIESVLPNNDGLKWFNFLYRIVTVAVRDHPPAEGWKNERWVKRLDVVFAMIYFRAIADFIKGAAIPSSWQALFEARHRAGIDRIQFALAGMNAHINHDSTAVTRVHIFQAWPEGVA